MVLSFIRSKLLCISTQIWSYIFVGLNLLLLSLILASLLSKEWVLSSTWSGGILRFNTGPFNSTHYSSMNCSNCIYAKLNTSGIIVITFDLLSLLGMLGWMGIIVYGIRGTEIMKYWAKGVVLAFVVVFHWVAIITWGAVTGITFEGDLHSGTGPALAVAVAVMQPVFVLLYMCVFKPEREHIPNMESIRVEGRHKWSDGKIEEAENRN
jgi:hypothetical protein